MRSLLLACALVLALPGVGLVAGPAAAAPPPSTDLAAPDLAAQDLAAPDLAALQADLDASAARAAALAAELERAAARGGGLRQALEDLAQQSDAAQARLDARVRQVFMRGGRDPLASLVVRFGSPVVARAAHAGLAASVRSERGLLDAVDAQSGRVRALQARAAAFRASLRGQAGAVLAEQERARRLLADARAALAQQAEQEQAAAAREAADAAQQEAARQRLVDVTARLDEVSASVTRSLTPAQTARSRRAQQREAPLIALAEAAGPGYPAGFAPTGERISGTASWYGPGFVGSPTASGAPYDPERLTCAHKTLPLGTLLRVVRGARAVTCLVDDRGPFVGDRVLDLSRAGSRALGYDGTAEVVAEVLAPR